MAMIYTYSESIKSIMGKEKGVGSKVQRSLDVSFQESLSPDGVTLNSSNNKMHNTCEMLAVYQGRSLETQFSAILIGASEILHIC